MPTTPDQPDADMTPLERHLAATIQFSTDDDVRQHLHSRHAVAHSQTPAGRRELNEMHRTLHLLPESTPTPGTHHVEPVFETNPVNRLVDAEDPRATGGPLSTAGLFVPKGDDRKRLHFEELSIGQRDESLPYDNRLVEVTGLVDASLLGENLGALSIHTEESAERAKTRHEETVERLRALGTAGNAATSGLEGMKQAFQDVGQSAKAFREGYETMKASLTAEATPELAAQVLGKHRQLHPGDAVRLVKPFRELDACHEGIVSEAHPNIEWACVMFPLTDTARVMHCVPQDYLAFLPEGAAPRTPAEIAADEAMEAGRAKAEESREGEVPRLNRMLSHQAAELDRLHDIEERLQSMLQTKERDRQRAARLAEDRLTLLQGERVTHRERQAELVGIRNRVQASLDRAHDRHRKAAARTVEVTAERDKAREMAMALEEEVAKLKVALDASFSRIVSLEGQVSSLRQESDKLTEANVRLRDLVNRDRDAHNAAVAKHIAQVRDFIDQLDAARADKTTTVVNVSVNGHDLQPDELQALLKHATGGE